MATQNPHPFRERVKRFFRKLNTTSGELSSELLSPQNANVAVSQQKTEGKDCATKVKVHADDLSQNQHDAEELPGSKTVLKIQPNILNAVKETQNCYMDTPEDKKSGRSVSPKLDDHSKRQDLWADAYNQLEDKAKGRLSLPRLDKDIPNSKKLNTDNRTEDPDSLTLSKGTLGEPMKGTDIKVMIENMKRNLESISTADKENKWKSRIFRTLEALTRFKQLADEAIKFDPTKYAALAWGVVSFGLEAAVRHHKVRNQALGSTDFLAGLLVKYAAYERLFRQTETRVNPSQDLINFEKELSRAYKAILQYCGFVKEHFTTIIPLSIMDPADSAIKSAEAPINESDSSLRDLVNILEYNSHTDSFQALKTQINKLISPVYALQINVDDIKAYVDAFTISKWFPDTTLPIEPFEYRNRICRLNNVGQWLLDDSSFRFWTNSILPCAIWLRGDMGTGKTMLTTITITAIKAKYGKTHEGALAFVYCSGSSGLKPTANQVLRRILYQLIQAGSNSKIFNDWASRNRHDDGSALSDKAITSIIQNIISRPRDTIEQTTIIIDALDELSHRDQITILDSMNQFLSHQGGLLKVFISSRPLANMDIKTNSIVWTEVEVSAFRTNRDLQKWVDDEVDTYMKHNSDEKTRESIKNHIKTSADGNFQFVDMVLQGVLSVTEPELALSTISETKNLVERYQKLYNQSQDGQLEVWQTQLASWIVTWLLGQQCELKGSEILKAIQPRLNYKRINPETAVSCCQYLVNYDKTKDRFTFRHFSVVEFFRHKENSGAFGHNKIHERLAGACMQFHCDISQFHLGLYDDPSGALKEYFKNVRDWEKPQVEYTQWKNIPRTRDSFLPYAHELWAYHCGQSDGSQDSKWVEFFQSENWVAYHGEKDALGLEILTVFNSSELRTSLSHRLGFSRAGWSGGYNIELNTYMFFVGCAFGIPSLIKYMLEKRPELLHKEWGSQYSPMSSIKMAARWDQTGGTEILLKSLIEIVPESDISKDIAYTLHRTSEHGNIDLVKVVLDAVKSRGADLVSFVVNYSIYWTPLISASRHDHLEVAKLLLEAGADPRAVISENTTRTGGTALVAAADFGSKKMTAYLCQKFPDLIEVRDAKGMTPLSIAAQRGNLEVVERLLQFHADVNARDNEGRNVLWYAAPPPRDVSKVVNFGERQRLVTILTESGAQGADIEIIDES